MEFSKLTAGDKINYIGDSFAFGGEYKLYPIEETYQDVSQCPEKDKGKVVIIEFMNDDTPMFFTLEMLNPTEWELASNE